MKISPQFWQNQLLIKTIILIGVVISTPILSKEKAQQIPGIFSTFKEMIQIDQTKYNRKVEKLVRDYTKIIDLKSINQIEVDPDFLTTILFHSNDQYNVLSIKDECAFYDVFLADLFKGPSGRIEKVIVQYKNKKDILKTALINRKEFVNKVIKVKCPNSITLKKHFTLKNIPNTLKTVSFPSPTNKKECNELHESFINDVKTPHLCHIYEKATSVKKLELKLKRAPRSNYRQLQKIQDELSVAKIYRSKLNISQYDYLDNLCRNLKSNDLFCESFFHKSFYGKIVRGEKDPIYIRNICQQKFQRKKLSKRDYVNCVSSLESDKNQCLYHSPNFPALSPKPNCEMISKALNYSSLNTNYHDCPGRMGNESIVNSARIIRHLENAGENNTKVCSTPLADSFVKFNNENDNDNAWGIELCYENKIYNREVCHPTLLDNLEGSPYSLSKTIAKILYKTRGMSKNMACKFVHHKRYHPKRLEFQSGCVIVYQDNCTSTKCEFNIYHNQKEIKFIKQKQLLNFDYYSNSIKKQKFSQHSLIKSGFKLKSKTIKNLTELQYQFKQFKNTVIHGVGCAEDLLPTFFKKNSLNQCKPLPFIIDGIIEKDDRASLVTRTAIDNLHSPRIISWSNIFSSVQSYQVVQPMNTWSLDAFY